MIRLANNLLAIFDVEIVRKSVFRKLLSQSEKFSYYELIDVLSKEFGHDFLKIAQDSRSQLGQDLFVLSQLDLKRCGYFVEFGATNGVDLSNTYLLEKEFGWQGILAEPARQWHSELRNNRASYIETDCVWSASNKSLVFNEILGDGSGGELSTIDDFSFSDGHKNSRKNGKKYSVNTISLGDMLRKYNAPKDIDYLSIDTEGSEFDILNAFDFDEYRIKTITCEHNFGAAQAKIHSLLTSKGYVQKYCQFSSFDGWYSLNE